MTARPPGPPLVLVVDPDPDARAILAAFFQHAGYEVELADCSAAGLDAARRLRPAVIVGEHPIHSADGTTLCDALRVDPTTAGIPFLALTSRVTDAEFDHAASSHFRVMAKPPDFAALLHAIRDAIERDER